MREQIKVFTSKIHRGSTHEQSVNEFIKTNIELVKIENTVTHGYENTSSQLVTIITYKEMY